MPARMQTKIEMIARYLSRFNSKQRHDISVTREATTTLSYIRGDYIAIANRKVP